MPAWMTTPTYVMELAGRAVVPVPQTLSLDPVPWHSLGLGLVGALVIAAGLAAGAALLWLMNRVRPPRSHDADPPVVDAHAPGPDGGRVPPSHVSERP